MGLTEFFNSPWFYVIVVFVVAYVLLHIISKEVFGKPIGAVILANRRINFKDIEANFHLQLYRQTIRAAKLSRNSYSRNLYIKPLDYVHYTTERAGMKRLGTIVGISTYQSAHVIVYKLAWWRVRKFIFIAPPDLLLSSSSARNLIYEGISVDLLGTDYVFPVPSSQSKYTESQIRIWAQLQYDQSMKEFEKTVLTDFAPYLLIKSGSDSVETRMQMQGVATVTQRTEMGESDVPKPPTETTN